MLGAILRSYLAVGSRCPGYASATMPCSSQIRTLPSAKYSQRHQYKKSNPIRKTEFTQQPQPRLIMTSASLLARAKPPRGRLGKKKANEQPESYVTKAFVNWTSGQVASWLEEQGMLTANQARIWSLDGYELAQLKEDELKLTIKRKQIRLAIRKKTGCNEENFTAIVDDAVATLGKR